MVTWEYILVGLLALTVGGFVWSLYENWPSPRRRC